MKNAKGVRKKFRVASCSVQGPHPSEQKMEKKKVTMQYPYLKSYPYLQWYPYLQSYPYLKSEHASVAMVEELRQKLYRDIFWPRRVPRYKTLSY